MRIRTPSDNMKVVQVIAPLTITDDVNGVGVDCSGWETLLVIVEAGDIPAANTLTVKLQESSDDGVGDAYADITGATTPELAPADDDEVYIMDVNLSERERYIRAVASEVGATPLCSVTFVLMDGRHLPPTQENTVVQVGYQRIS